MITAGIETVLAIISNAGAARLWTRRITSVPGDAWMTTTIVISKMTAVIGQEDTGPTGSPTVRGLLTSLEASILPSTGLLTSVSSRLSAVMAEVM